MSLSKIDDMDVIAYRCAIFGFIVVSKDSEVWTTSDCDLSEEWEEIVGYS
jgi:hypothetical protein